MTIENDFIPLAEIPELLEIIHATTLGRSIRTWRKTHEDTMTQEQLAHKLGISKQQLSAYERSEKLPSLQKTIEMATLLNAPLSLWIRYRIQDEMRSVGLDADVKVVLKNVV